MTFFFHEVFLEWLLSADDDWFEWCAQIMQQPKIRKAWRINTFKVIAHPFYYIFVYSWLWIQRFWSAESHLTVTNHHSWMNSVFPDYHNRNVFCSNVEMCCYCGLHRSKLFGLLSNPVNFSAKSQMPHSLLPYSHLYILYTVFMYYIRNTAPHTHYTLCPARNGENVMCICHGQYRLRKGCMADIYWVYIDLPYVCVCAVCWRIHNVPAYTHRHTHTQSAIMREKRGLKVHANRNMRK